VRTRLTGIIRRRQQSRDDGFSLIELIIAVFIIGGVLLALVALQTRAMVSIAHAKERQQATAIANEILEELRALPWKTITRGPAAGAYSASPFASGGKLTITGEPITDEELISRSGDIPADDAAIGSPFDGIGGTNHTIHTDPALPGFEFHAYTYLTQDGVGTPYNLTVLVKWTPRGKTEERHVIARTSAFNTNSGCGSAETRPYATACQDFYLADSQISAPSISLSGSSVSDGSGTPGSGPYEIVPGSGIQGISITGASANVAVDAAQTAKLKGTANNGSVVITDLSGDVTESALGSINLEASNSVTSSDPKNDSATLGSSSGSIPPLSGAGVQLIVDSGSRSGNVAVNTSSGCAGWANNTHPCGSSGAANGDQSVSLKIGSDAVPLLEIVQSKIESTVARYPGGTTPSSGAGHCTTLAGSGCTESSGVLTVRDAIFPGVGALSNVEIAATTARGAHASQRENNVGIERSGSLSLEWPGAPTVGSIGPSVSGEFKSEDPVLIYDDGGVAVYAEPVISIGEADIRSDFTDPECRASSCDARGTFAPITAQITYTVTSGTDEFAFTLSTSLGDLRSSATFKAAPEAWQDD